MVCDHGVYGYQKGFTCSHSSIQQYVAPVAEILIIERNIAYFNGDTETVKRLDLEIKQRKHEIPERDTLNQRGKLYMERLRKELMLRRNEEEMKQVLETQKLIIDSLKTKKEVSSILITNIVTGKRSV